MTRSTYNTCSQDAVDRHRKREDADNTRDEAQKRRNEAEKRPKQDRCLTPPMAKHLNWLEGLLKREATVRVKYMQRGSA